MDTFVVDVQFSTHDDLKNGVFLGFRRFRVLAPDGDAAMLLAAQWVAAGGFMPTATTVCI